MPATYLPVGELRPHKNAEAVAVDIERSVVMIDLMLSKQPTLVSQRVQIALARDWTVPVPRFLFSFIACDCDA